MTNHQNKCFISLVIKALEIKKKFKLYTSEKEYAKSENKDAELKKCLGSKFSESFNSLIKAPKNEKKVSFFNKILVEDSSDYFILKSVLGFFGGIFLTYICFMFLVFSLNFTLKRATYICMGLGMILSLGLAFSVKIRCTVFLCIPQLFSKRGRQALLAYAFILALSGPAKNTLHNVEVMSESLACTQEQLKQAENELSKCVQKPNAAAKKSLEKLLEKINYAVKDFKHFILQLYKTCFDILQTVFQAQKWLYSISFLCNKKMGKPAHRCLNLLAETRENCEASVPFDLWKKYCKINPYTLGLLCSVKEDSICKGDDLPQFIPVLKLQKQLNDFKHRAMNIFYVSIETHQTYYQTNRTFTYHEEYQGMATEIRQKTDQFLQYFDFMSVIFGIFILVLFIKVIIYRHKFLTQDHFDNRYITNDFVDIDNTRAAFQMETLLPLTCREKMEYIKVWSVRLVPSERVQLFSSFVFLIFATFKIIIHMLTDSSLYWILSTVRREERLLYLSTIREDEIITTVKVIGHGLVAALVRNVTTAVRRESSLVRFDPTPCLPDPVPPDWNRYCQIIALVIICWLLALCEPYGLRLRHAVMVTYHPDRARERAIWLYNRIISDRVNLVKTSRRHLRRKYKDVGLEKTIGYNFMRKASSPKCLLCEAIIYSFDNHVKCNTVNCLGLYCASCFARLKFCCICSDPAKYDDMSDLSEEKDSSDEECIEVKTSCKSSVEKEPKPKKKKGVALDIKNPNLKLKIYDTTKDMQKCNLNHLIQPTFFCRALQHCKDKVNSLNRFNETSDTASSEWDYISFLIPEGSSNEDNRIDLNFKGDIECGGIEKKRKTRSRKSEKSIKSHKTEKELKKPKSTTSQRRNVGFLNKISALDFNFEAKDKTSKVSKQKSISVGNIKENKCDSDTCLNDACSQKTKLLKAKDSIQLLRTKKKYSKEQIFKSKSEKGRKLSSGTEKSDSNFGLENSNVEVFLDLMKLNSESRKQKPVPQIFPFVDPINVHEFDQRNSEEDLSYKSAIENLSKESLMREKANRASSSVKPVFFSPENIGFYDYEKSSKSSLDTTPEKIKICFEETETSSVASSNDYQFYTEPYPPLCSHFSSKANICSKKISSKSNLTPKTRKCGKFYSPETNSSEDKHSSVKTSRRTRKKPKKCKENKMESDEILKLMASSSQAVQSKRNDFFKAKVYQFCKKKIRERKSSDDGGSSDIDDVEYTPNNAVLLSDEEFQEISRQISSRSRMEIQRNSEAPKFLELPKRKTRWNFHS